MKRTPVFFDCEFIEDGETIELLSLGAVTLDGHEFYAVNSEAKLNHASAWVLENVVPQLDMIVNPLLYHGDLDHEGGPDYIAQAFFQFVSAARNRGGTPKVDFWGYYADYDWVTVCQLYGPMVDLPEGFPMLAYDMRQYLDTMGRFEMKQPENAPHHALLDARWVREAYLLTHPWANPKLYSVETPEKPQPDVR